MCIEESDSEDETGSIPSDEDETLDLDQVYGQEQSNTNPELPTSTPAPRRCVNIFHLFQEQFEEVEE